MAERRVDTGNICMFSTVEPGSSLLLKGNKATQKPELHTRLPESALGFISTGTMSASASAILGSRPGCVNPEVHIAFRTGYEESPLFFNGMEPFEVDIALVEAVDAVWYNAENAFAAFTSCILPSLM